jgi:hypothetical protein
VYQATSLSVGLAYTGGCSHQAADALRVSVTYDLQQLLINAVADNLNVVVTPGPCRSSSNSSHASIQWFTIEVIQPLPKADYTGSGNTLLSGSAKVLQQLRQAIAAGGSSAGLPITTDSVSRVTGRALVGTSTGEAMIASCEIAVL